MQTNTVQYLVTTKVAEMCRLDPACLRLDMTLQELGLDSLGLTLIAAQMEDALSCPLSQDQLLQLFQATSLRELVAIAPGEPQGTTPATSGRAPA